MIFPETQAKIDYFNNLGDNWDEKVGNNSERSELLRNIFKMIVIEKGNRVLDVGCGNGVLFPLIEEMTGTEGIIYALDPAEAMIRRARKLYPQYSNIRYMTTIAEDANLKHEYYDAIICFAVFPHIDNKTLALQLFQRALKSGGKLYIFHLSDTNSLNEFHGNVNGPVCKDMMPGKDELEKMLGEASLTLLKYIDTEGLNFIECGKC